MREGRRVVWNCECSCGKFVTERADILLRGKRKSCGCMRAEGGRTWLLANRPQQTHGLSKTPEYQTWKHMMQRCKPTHKSHADYHDRSICVCPEWSDIKTGFLTFLSYLKLTIGMRPGKNRSLDRIENDRGYEPGNMRWATRSEQMRNIRPRFPLSIFESLKRKLVVWTV